MMRSLILLCCAFVTLAVAACVKLPRRAPLSGSQNAPPTAHAEPTALPRINLNTATRDELEKLPGIGASLAARIVEHRARYGSFRRPEHLMSVRGISARRFRQVRARVTVE